MTASHVLLTTSRLSLRRFEQCDVASLTTLDADPFVMEHISRGQPTPADEIAREILPRWIARYATGSCIGYWAAEHLPHRAFIGWFHLRPDKFAPQDMELGYRLMRHVWGQGLATEGSTALMEHAFRSERIVWISARTLVGNTSSRRVLEKCGFELVEEFYYPETMLVGWPREARRAVRYRLHRDRWLEDQVVRG